MIRACLMWLALCGAVWAECPAEGPFPPFYGEAAPFEAALEATAAEVPAPDPVLGVTVPHHLAQPDLIALGLRRASGARPGRILVLFPDHFYRLRGPFGTTARGFETVLGPVPPDPGAAALVAGGFAEASCLFAADHGLRAVLPFLARLHPGVPVLPLAIAVGSSRADWERAAEALAPLAGPETLVVQATDFSHYLPHHTARQRDQQVLNLMAAGDLDAIAALRQPDHVDSLGALYIMTRLMQAHGAAPVVIANRNLQEDEPGFVAETTSYIVALHQPPGADPGPPPVGGHVAAIGGDFFVGRVMPRFLYDEPARARVVAAARRAAHGAPLVLNLEGVLLPEMPSRIEELVLAMPAALAVELAGEMGVAGFGLANNHANDIGASGGAETRAALRAAGIPFAGPGEALELPGFTLVALTDLDGAARPQVDRLAGAGLDTLIRADAARPVVAFVHWGREGQPGPGPREEALALAMSRRGAVAVVGAHPHVASGAAMALSGGDTLVFPSLGNFLFDQLPGESSGALVEIRSFPQGTLFLRQLPLPHLFSIARGSAG